MDACAEMRGIPDLKAEMSRGVWCVIGPRASGKTQLCAACVPDAGGLDSNARTWLLDPVIPIAPREFATHLKVIAAVSRRKEDLTDDATPPTRQPSNIVIVVCSLSQIPPIVREMLTGVVMMRNSHVPTLKSVYTSFRNTDWPKFEAWCEEIDAQHPYSAVCIPAEKFLCARPTYFHVVPIHRGAPAPDSGSLEPAPSPEAEPAPSPEAESAPAPGAEQSGPAFASGAELGDQVDAAAAGVR